MTETYADRRGEIATYFDATAVDAWAQLTSDAPVSGIRQTVRQGRDRMREILLSWLAYDLSHHTLLDAGCGTGALAFAAARRGASVTAVDLSANLIALAQDRAPSNLTSNLNFRVGDMSDASLGAFDHVVAMDSLIHYQQVQVVDLLAQIAPRVRQSILFTFAPRTPALALMHATGRLFPRSNRSPAIEPITETRLHKAIARAPALARWRLGRTERVSSGFYTSQAVELVRR
ncbi:MAG: magnesium protoporphyrin IX methyltransferase [Caulobacteraceae bacterium]